MLSFLNRLSVRGKLFAGFGIVLALMVVMSLLAFRQLASLHHQTESIIEQSVDPMIVASAMQSANKDIGIAVRDIVSLESVAAQKEATKGLKVEQKQFLTVLDEAKKLSASGAAESALIKKVDGQYAVLAPMIEEVLVMVDEANFDGAKVFVFTKLRPKQLELSATISEFVKIQVNDAKETAEASRTTFTLAAQTLLLFVLIALVIGGVIAWIITNGIVRPLLNASRFAEGVAQGDFTKRIYVTGRDEVARLSDGLNRMSESLGATIREIRLEADRTAGCATALAADAQQASARSQEQVDQVMAVTSAMEQMSVSIREVSTNADGVNQAAGKARALSNEGCELMAHNLGDVQLIVQQVDASGRVIAELSDAVRQISAVTNVIKEIADQTNLLALNAAIEAARAGEQGRGFAVVADEVRKLAERTQRSTAEIGDMLARVEDRANETVAAMDRVKVTVEGGSRDSTAVDATLRQIVDAAGEVSVLVADIAAATQEQSRTTEVTARSIETISGVAEETSRTIQRVGDAAAEMNHVAQDLQQLVSKFRTND